MKKQCKHEKENLFYRNSVNEDGWECSSCETKLGFRPDLDKELIGIKVRGIMDDLYDGKFVYFSNGTDGEGCMTMIIDECILQDRYDQYFITKEIINLKWESHSNYYKQKSIKQEERK